jgi:aspartate/methionine/tyrosine aminotransferase
MLSSRSSFDLSPNALACALSRLAATAGHPPILDLTESNPTRALLPYDREAILAAIASPAALQYEPAPFGLASAREAVARHLADIGPAIGPSGLPSILPSRVALTASTSEAYAFLFKLLCDPGDDVLVPHPSYPLFEHLARLEGVHAVPYRLAYDGAWHIDAASAARARTPRTRALVLVSPNNPTGSFVKTVELDALAALGLPIVSDEVFSEYSLRDDPGRAPSALAAAGAGLVFALGGLSKLAALPQMKLGWIAVGGETGAVDGAMARLEIIADAFLSVGTPVQHALPALLSARGPTLRAIRARTRANFAALRAAAEGSAVTVLDVEGGWYATLRLPRTQSEEEWVLAFLEHDHVHVHPGHFFDFEDEAYAIVSLLTPEDTLREGAARIVARVQSS